MRERILVCSKRVGGCVGRRESGCAAVIGKGVSFIALAFVLISTRGIIYYDLLFVGLSQRVCLYEKGGATLSKINEK